jgi:hypothetical protein
LDSRCHGCGRPEHSTPKKLTGVQPILSLSMKSFRLFCRPGFFPNP